MNPYQTPVREDADRKQGPVGIIDLKAGILERGAAYFIDVLVASLPAHLVLMLAEANDVNLSTQQEWLDHALFVIAAFICYLVFNWFMLVDSGISIGKRAMNIRIVQRSGELLSRRKSILREFLRMCLFPAIPVLVLIDGLSMYSARRRTIHDRLTGSYVVQGKPKWLDTRSYDRALARWKKKNS
ncbi:RDD family protein [Persicirhabdus sediminis]|uniref:RDD family protein n=1 Tax=Persicirhabdus sediminis TaxID=454144 RepID=UPI002D80FC83|nr:RDD family protein [Persicirhabdus sediminis]